jgi:hypothetical protein
MTGPRNQRGFESKWFQCYSAQSQSGPAVWGFRVHDVTHTLNDLVICNPNCTGRPAACEAVLGKAGGMLNRLLEWNPHLHSGYDPSLQTETSLEVTDDSWGLVMVTVWQKSGFESSFDATIKGISSKYTQRSDRNTKCDPEIDISNRNHDYEPARRRWRRPSPPHYPSPLTQKSTG